MCSSTQIVLLLLCLFCYVKGLNILGIFEIPSKSLHILGHEMFVGLAKRGYNVTLISSFPVEEKIENYSHVYIDGLLQYKEKNMVNLLQGQSSLGSFSLLNVQNNLVNITLHSNAMKEFLKSDSKYDVIIQTYVFNEAYLALAHHFNARVIAFVPFSTMPQILDITGNSAPLSYVPLPFLGLTDSMNFIERTMNVAVGIFVSMLHYYYLFPKQDQIFREHFPDFPTLTEIKNDRVDLVFSNAHFSNESPRPKTPNIIYIGGYHVQEPEPLTQEVQKLLDNASEGVVFLAFGTNVDTAKLPKEKIDAFVRTFEKIPYKVLLKFDGILLNKPKNVEVIAWVPQRGVLAHPNVKLFISHGGKGSSTESLYFGVPVLCVSFYGDQKKNCEDIVDYGYGVHLPYLEVTGESFEEAFNEINNNPKYNEKAKYRSALFKEQEMDPLSRAVFWIEHIHKFKGAKHLQPKSVTMPLYQYLLLDVWAFIICSVLLGLFIQYKIIKCVLLRICRKVASPKEGKMKIKRQ